MASKYKAIKVNGKKMNEHRYVMEQFLGRKLGKNEVVHHINGDQKDNRVENLQLMSLKEHSKLHMEERMTEERKKELSDARKGKPNYKLRLFDDEQKMKIIEDVKRGKSCYAIAKEYGVAKTTITRMVNGQTYI